MEKLGTVNGPEEGENANRESGPRDRRNRGQTMTAKIELCVIRQNL
jgi:hypothetical protein